MTLNRAVLTLASFLLIAQLQGPVHSQELEQDPIVIRGEQANPKTMYVTPWKRVDRPLQPGPVPGSWQADHSPVDRELFSRELDLQLRGYSVQRPGDPTEYSPDAGTGVADPGQ